MLPVPVLERCASEMLNYKGSGMSVMEMSHRSKVYDGIIKETEATLRRVLSIPTTRCCSCRAALRPSSQRSR